ncbi:hypothetical protein B0H13DRAFT_2319195 [Mycena leptocephala]|nr:hypothetical protein B0H13DRAFT_2319195 [Mycena leptocephala]
MARPRQRHPPEVDESDPKSIARYKKWCSSYLYNYYNGAERNRKTRERMTRLRAKQASDSPKVKQERLEAKRAAQEHYREKNRAILAQKSRCRRRVQTYRREQAKTQAFRRAGREGAALEAAIGELEPRVPDDNYDDKSDSDKSSDYSHAGDSEDNADNY